MGDRVYKDIIGIVGGMGSFSTLYLFKEILNSFSMIEDSERPRIIIDNYCNIPNKIDACLFSDKKEPFLSCLSASVTNLIKLGCTKIIIACNITHVLLDDLFAIHPHFKKYIINMMDIILRRLRVNDVNKAYLFATNNAIQSKVFHKYLENVELKSLEDKIDYEEIFFLMKMGKSSDVSEEMCKRFTVLCNKYRKEPKILGCTELSMIYANSKIKNDVSFNIYDPIYETVKYLVEILE